MKYLLPMLLFFHFLVVPAAALEISPPEVPAAGVEIMPENTDSFADALLELLKNAISRIHPNIKEACHTSLSVVAAVMVVSLLNSVSENIRQTVILVGTVTISALLIRNVNAMISLGADTIQELSDYGKLLCPVMTTAVAAQGGVTASAALYIGTAAFNMFLGSLISKVFVPMVFLFLALSAANSALGEDLLKRMRDFVKNTVSWCLKTVLILFTTYMSLTGVVTGATDAAALKAARLTISSVVPIVGGILSDASEAILVSAGVMKNAAGIYGIIAILALFLEPFLRIGIHYLTLKATSTVCSLLGSKEISGLIEDFAAAMGLMLAMTSAMCVLLLISTVCFIKGVS